MLFLSVKKLLSPLPDGTHKAGPLLLLIFVSQGCVANVAIHLLSQDPLHSFLDASEDLSADPLRPASGGAASVATAINKMAKRMRVMVFIFWLSS